MSVLTFAAVDRRSPNRLPTPSCPHCGTDEFVVGGDPHDEVRVLSLPVLSASGNSCRR